jgi:hypothetical protein
MAAVPLVGLRGDGSIGEYRPARFEAAVAPPVGSSHDRLGQATQPPAHLSTPHHPGSRRLLACRHARIDQRVPTQRRSPDVGC